MKMLWLRRNALILITIILLLVSLGWTYSVLQTPAPAQEKEQYLTVTPNYQIVMRKPSTVWLAGTTLDQGMVGYFYAGLPMVNITPSLEINGVDQGQFKGTVQSRVVLQAVNDKGKIYWNYQLQEAPLETFAMSKDIPNQADNLKYTAQTISVDVTAAYEQAVRIGEEILFNQGIYQLVLSTDVQLSGTINNSKIVRTLHNALPLTLQEAYFSIPKTADSISQLKVNAANNRPAKEKSTPVKVMKQYWQPLTADVVLMLILLIIVLRKKMKIPKTVIEHRRFKEWITEGSIQVKDRVSIDILSLEGLVDVAIDLDKRVIYDTERKKYYVLDENLVYAYDPEKTTTILGNKHKLGKVLLTRGLLTPEQLEIGLYYQQRIGTQLGESLIALGFINEIDLYSTLAAQSNLSFCEINPNNVDIDSSWIKKIPFYQARILLALPLGERTDGKLVVACAYPFKEGIKNVLSELFNTEIIIVTVRPSVINNVIERIELQDQQKRGTDIKAGQKQVQPFERLSQEEWTRFTSAYYRGTFIPELLLQASGLVSQELIAQASTRGSSIGWLVNKTYLDSDIANILRGLGKTAEGMERKLRQEKKIPGLLELLQQADYLTAQDIEWVSQEMDLLVIPLEKLLIDSYLASSETIEKAIGLLSTLDNILHNNPIVPLKDSGRPL